MFRLWGKLIKENKLLKDMVICNDESNQSRTKKVYQSLEDLCYAFDLQKPIWLDSNVKSFQVHSKTRFNKDSFIESIDFDYLEIQVIEEDH